MTRLARSHLVLTCLAVLVLTTMAQPGHGQLGTINFPNSGAPAAQAEFVRGVLLLHSFEYDDAAKAFQQAQRLDSAFALAYWGEAMTYTHPVWNRQDLPAARAALAGLASTAEARQSKARTLREKAYLAAAEVLYGEGSKPRRDTLYSAAMERLTRAYPADDEARAFYALSLLGLNQGDRELWSYMHAAALSQEILDKSANHPGAAHYLIHAFDDPAHAPLGLRAARAYSKIAPDAAHAQHMTSHIFVAMGLWDDVVSANELAMKVTERQRGRSPLGCGHYNEWLEYGYLQQGRTHEAERLVNECWADIEGRGGPHGAIERMRSIYLIDSRDWNGPVARRTTDTTRELPWARTLRDFTDGLRAVEIGDLATARLMLDRVSRRPLLAANKEVMVRTLRAAVAFADRQSQQALAELERAATLEDSLPFEFGPPAALKPPREFKGEYLLALERPAEAAREFEQALRRTPRRVATLLGLARASARAGDTERALAVYAELKGIWHRAEPGISELAEADQYLAHRTSARR